MRVESEYYDDHRCGKDCSGDVPGNLVYVRLLRIRIAPNHTSKNGSKNHPGEMNPRQSFVNGRSADFITAD
jgi:hypothetical protein